MAKRKHNKSATKGSNNERGLCRAFSQWWTEGKDESVFWRTAGSGSRATSRRKRGKEDKWNHGDMRPDDPAGFSLCSKWCFEFKAYKKYDIKGVLHHVADNGNWIEWWAKLVDEAESINRSPVLITKQNTGVPVIWFHRDLWIQLKNVSPIQCYPNIRLGITKRDVKVHLRGQERKTKTVHLETHGVFGIALDAFFDSVKPERLQAAGIL